MTEERYCKPNERLVNPFTPNQNGIDKTLWLVMIACPKQGNKIEVVDLNRVCILGFFCPKQGQGFKPSAAHLYPNMGRVPPLGIQYTDVDFICHVFVLQ